MIKKVEYKGKLYTFVELAEETGIDKRSLQRGARKGWSAKKSVEFFREREKGFPKIKEITKLPIVGYIIPYNGRGYQIKELTEILDIHVDRGTITDYIRENKIKTADELIRILGPAEERAKRRLLISAEKEKMLEYLEANPEEVRFTRAWLLKWFEKNFKIGDKVKLPVLVAEGGETRQMRLTLKGYTSRLAIFCKTGGNNSVCFNFAELYEITQGGKKK